MLSTAKIKTMDIAEIDAYDPDNTLFPSDMWADLFEDTIASDPEVVHLFAELMLGVKQAIDCGAQDPKEARRAANTLMDLIHELFVYSETFRAARRLWILSLEGRISAPNDPEHIIPAAIERGLKETLASRARFPRKGRSQVVEKPLKNAPGRNRTDRGDKGR